MEALLTGIDRTETLRYLGCRGAFPPEIVEQADNAAEEILRTARPRWVYREYALERDSAGLRVAGTFLKLPGKDIQALLEGCSSAVFFAVTLGAEAEALVRRAELTDMGKALIFDCCMSAAVENVCDNLQEKLEKDYQGRGLFLTDRYSPGYGDLPITVQRDFLTILDASRRIGLTCTAESILVPRKSVTAILGVARTLRSRREKCGECTLSDSCPYRKDGKTCGK